MSAAPAVSESKFLILKKNISVFSALNEIMIIRVAYDHNFCPTSKSDRASTDCELYFQLMCGIPTQPFKRRDVMKLCRYKYQNVSGEDFWSTVAVRCIPNEGVNLYRFRARLSKRYSSDVYYVLGRNKTEARFRFKSLLPYMEILQIEFIPPCDEAEEILTNPLKFPI